MEKTPEEKLEIVETAGVGFNPMTQHLDLSKDEKRRTTALMMAISAYRELIIKEADYLREAGDLARRGELPPIKAATIDAMIEAAMKFDIFISGETFPSSGDQGIAQTSVKKDAK